MPILSKLLQASLLATLSLTSAFAQAGSNLIQDASFESGLRPWFSEHTRNGGQGYYIDFLKTKEAPDGDFVLDVRGWGNSGWSRILSPVLALSGSTYSATIKVRCIGENPTTLELAIYSSKEGFNQKKKLVSFAEQTLLPDGQWTTISGEGILPEGTEDGQFAIVVRGHQKGTRIELDQAGLFAGSEPGPVSNNVQTFSWPAYTLANEEFGWNPVEPHFYDRAIGPKQLQNGGSRVAIMGEAVATAEITQPGKYNLWVRCSKWTDNPTIELRQNGSTVASMQIESNKPDHIPMEPSSAGWVLLTAELAKGPVEAVLQNPDGKGSLRRFDHLVLTNYTDYVPIPQDFRPRGYIRFTNRSEEPFCLSMRGPFNGYGIIDHAGFQPSGVRVNSDTEAWIAPGESSPWVRITDQSPKWAAKLSVTAIVGDHLQGLYKGRFVGDLEFAYGPERTVAKTFQIDQASPRFLMMIPYDFQNMAEEFRSGHDFLKETQAAVASLPSPSLAKRIRIFAGLNFNTEMDDPLLIKGEIDVVKKLGMNSLYIGITPPDQDDAFAAAHGLVPTTRIWSSSLHVRPGLMKADPDVEKIDASAKASASRYANVLDQVDLIKIADEPYGQSWEGLLAAPNARGRFVDYLQKRNLTLDELGLTSWDDVKVVGPAGKNDSPVLHYYSGLYRLQIFKDQIDTTSAIWHKYFPKTALVYVNFVPSYGMNTADEFGYDLFGLMRNGGPDMIWSEDWRTYGVSVQQTSDYMALLTSANRVARKPLGGYCVAQELLKANPLIARIKAYTWLSAGATMLDFYSYGPQYCSIDAWSFGHRLYPAIASVGADVAQFEEALEGLEPRPSSIAILYNRTAGIWREYAGATEPDSRYIQWALADSGHAPEFVCEDEVDEGILSRYKILYLNGVQLREKTAKNIAKWVQEGGALVGTAGAGTQDEFARSQAILDSVFGVQSNNLSLAAPVANMPIQAPLEVLSTTDSYPHPKMEIARMQITETLEPLSRAAQPLLTDGSGRTTGALHTYGKGKAIRLGFLPGAAFLHDATYKKTFESGLPQEYRPEVAQFISWPAELAGVEPVGRVPSTAFLATLKRWDSEEGATPKRSVVFVIDYSGKPNPDFSMTLPDAAHFTKIRTAHGASVTVTPVGKGQTRISFPLNAADAVIFE